MGSGLPTEPASLKETNGFAMILFQQTSGSGDARHRIAKRTRHSVRCIEQARELLFLSQHIIDIALSCGIRFQPRHTSAFKRTVSATLSAGA
jgi:AraC-like DNA-binding protein